jgi:hypothetical protein
MVRLYAYIGLTVIVWLAVVGYTGYRLRSLIRPSVTPPPVTTLPTIQEDKIGALEETLKQRSVPQTPPVVPPAAGFKVEPFD